MQSSVYVPVCKKPACNHKVIVMQVGYNDIADWTSGINFWNKHSKHSFIVYMCLSQKWLLRDGIAPVWVVVPSQISNINSSHKYMVVMLPNKAWHDFQISSTPLHGWRQKTT